MFEVTDKWPRQDSNPHLSGANVYSVPFHDASRFMFGGQKPDPRADPWRLARP